MTNLFKITKVLFKNEDKGISGQDEEVRKHCAGLLSQAHQNHN